MHSLRLLDYLRSFHENDDVETPSAFYKTRIPWKAPSAYLTIVFKPLKSSQIAVESQRLSIPNPFREFLTIQNGAMLFGGSLSIYGLVPSGTFLNRTDLLCRSPFDIASENETLPFCWRDNFFAIGSYSWNGDMVCLDRKNGQVILGTREKVQVLRRWSGLEDWLKSEMQRMAFLFDSTGRLLVAESRTTPSEIHESPS